MTLPRSARPCCRPSLRNQSWSASRLLISIRPFGSKPVGAVGSLGYGVEIGARALEICRHPSFGRLRLLLRELLGIDDHAVLAGEGQEILHPLPAYADIACGREGDERLEQGGTVDRLVAERGNHLGQYELDQLDLARLDAAALERLAELGGAGDALAHDRELAALQVLEVADGVRAVAAGDDCRKAESLSDLALVGHQLHGDDARK